MKWLRTRVVFDQGNLIDSSEWELAHTSYVRAIERIDNPIGSGKLMLRRLATIDNKVCRNGVTYLKSRFVGHMKEETWLTEVKVRLRSGHDQPTLCLYPSKDAYQEPIAARFGGFDFVSATPDGLRIATEWETGNISSSHRSLNKLCLALSNSDIDVGVLIVPSRDLYAHMTDRIGNIAELSPYLAFWEKMKHGVTRGLLAVTVVEHDELTDDASFEHLYMGMDGRAQQSR